MEIKINDTDDSEDIAVQLAQANSKLGKVKFEVFGEEMIDKEVKLSGNSGRVYLPPAWVGHRVKIIRID
jgi:putative transposon-encoded protein